MGLFSSNKDKVPCSICGEEINLPRNPKEHQLKDGWVCWECTRSLFGYTYDEINKLTAKEASEIVKKQKFYSAQEILKKYDIKYLGGYPYHNQIGFFSLYLIICKDFLWLKPIREDYDFKIIKIDYKDIISVTMVDSDKTSRRYGYLENKKVLQIEFYYEEKIMKMLLSLIIVSDRKEKIAYNEIIDFFAVGEGSKQLRKRPKENTISIPDEILKYKNLLDMGAITQEEYDTKKKELLNM